MSRFVSVPVARIDDGVVLTAPTSEELIEKMCHEIASVRLHPRYSPEARKFNFDQLKQQLDRIAA